MNTYYIKLKKGASQPIKESLREHLILSETQALELLAQGSVWNKQTNQRIRNPEFILTSQTVVVFRPTRKVEPYPFDPADIYFEDDDIFIIDKKAGFPTVPTPYAEISSLSYGLNLYYKKGTAYVINRLDLATGGLVVYAKNKAAEKEMHRLFQERRIRKWYLVKTEKKGPQSSRQRIKDELEFKGKIKKAESVITPYRETLMFYYYLARPLTGRTHQLRKHFSCYFCPIYNDTVYGPYKGYEPLGLTCVAYIFTHPFSGRKIVVKKKVILE